MSDVAKLAGVGTMTVSRVLNDNPRVSEENRNRVLSAIAELNYVPNEVARSLREQRARQIGIIVPTIRDPFFAICSDAVSTVAKANNYSVVLAISGEDPEVEFKEAARLLRRSIDGLVVIPAARGRSRLGDPAFANLPIVAVDRPAGRADTDCVVVENERGAYEGTRHLIEHKHRRIVHLSLARDLYTMQMRIRGYRQAMKEAGLTPQVEVTTGTPEDTLQVIRNTLRTEAPPTALFCANNVVSCSVFHALSALHIAVPEQIAVAGFDDFETADILKPAMTVVRQPFEDLGRHAAEILFARLEKRGKKRQNRTHRVVLPVELIVRKSCGC
ncbi:MAG: LacI family DNA-binding transcriptional regulator [Rhodospirillales bacterium]|nr:LacI family DNA-binding transcriptional regulator [Acetobacter sp.]